MVRCITFWGLMRKTFLIAAGLAGLWAIPAVASPWAEVGDNQLRSDIEYLAASGTADDLTTHWPLPWNSLVETLGQKDLSLAPTSIRAAARRLTLTAKALNEQGVTAMLSLDATNMPATVYGFDGMGRGKGAAQFSLGYSSEDYSGRLSVGVFSPNFGRQGNKLMMDGTYLATKVGGALIYGGYLDHWWGPGWISALSLSNNARPMPQIGIERLETSASSWPVLRWLGPWQLEFVVGMLDGPRKEPDTFWNGLRWTFHPLDGLEIGLARTQQFCGQGHPCSPLADYISFTNNSATSINKTNDQGVIDVKYSFPVMGVYTQAYMQLMNEDSSPITHSGTSHLFGVTAFLPARYNPVRLTVEYTDSVPTVNVFSFGSVLHGFAYNNYSYADGMRYRGRSLGFSLDSDSRLLSLQGSWTDSGGRFYEASFHHAVISNPKIGSDLARFYNVVTTAPVIANIAEVRTSLPVPGSMKLDLAARIQDDQPRPDKGFSASFEVALRMLL